MILLKNSLFWLAAFYGKHNASENPFRDAFAILAALALRTPKEELALVARFGQPYTDYMARTGRFIPRITKK